MSQTSTCAATAATSPPVDVIADARRLRFRWWWPAIGLALLVGLAGQVRVWASDRGLWGDEIYVATNVRSLHWWQMAGPLAYSQIAPPGWLIEGKLCYRAFGGAEQSLRLVGLLGAVATLVLTAVLARRAIGRAGAVLATSLVAVCPGLLYYAGEFKQYSTEAAAAMVLLLAVGLFVEDDPPGTRHRGRRTAALASIGLLVMPFSFSAIIVLAGTTTGGILVLLSRRRRRDAVALAVAATPAAVLGALMVWRRLSFPIPGNQYQIFPNGFPPEHASPSDLLAWPPRMWAGFVADPLAWRFPIVVLILVLVGLLAMALRGKLAWAGLLSGLGVAAFGAAAVRAYPWEGRIAVYLLAPTLITAAAGVDGLVRAAVHTVRALRSAGTAGRGTGRGVGRAVAALVALVVAVPATVVAASPSLADGIEQTRHPRYRDPGRDIFNEVISRVRPGDVIVFYSFSRPVAQWYSYGKQLPTAGFFRLVSAETCQPASVDAALAGAKRLWYVRAARFSQDPSDYHQRVLAALHDRGRVVESHLWPPGTAGSAGWTLVDLTTPSGPDLTTPPADPAHACLEVVP
jgi:hypothetical protein